MDGLWYRSVIGQARSLVRDEMEFVNNINVFPVADGDTGTNLYLTLDSVWKEVAGLEERHIGRMADAVARAALHGAKGNSGVILSQFLLGFRDEVLPYREINIPILVRALSRGSERARSAVSKPVEGTMLTVMREGSRWGRRFHDRFRDLGSFLEGMLNHAVMVLKESPMAMARLGKPKVIDSGAYGFTLFLEGMVKTIRNVKGYRVRGMKVEREHLSLYCSNYLIRGADPREVERLALDWGDSVIVVESDGQVKLHVHLRDPKAFEDVLSGIGEVVQRRVEKI